MEATIVDLRYKMKDVLKALNRRETVKIYYHGKQKGTLVPCQEKKALTTKKHPFFGLCRKQKKPVKKIMQELRKGRYHAL